MDEVEYTLLEIIEGPKRINNMSHDKLFKYLLESCESQDRFETFMGTLEKNAWWAYLGFCLMASDMVPLSKIFEEEFSELTDVKYAHGSANEFSVFSMMLSYFDKGIFNEKKHRVYFIRYMAESLAKDQYEFCVTCLKQVYKQEIFDKLKTMFINNKMNVNVREFFSFCMNHYADSNNHFTKYCLPMKKYKKYVKVGSVIFDNDKIIDARVNAQIMKYLNATSQPGPKQIVYPNICELYVVDDMPFMFTTTIATFLIREPKVFNDATLIELLYQGYDTLICSNGSYVESIISEKNGFVSYKEAKCVKVKRINMPLLILSMGVDILLCELDDGSEISAFVPTRLAKTTFEDGETLKFVKYNETYYLLGD